MITLTFHQSHLSIVRFPQTSLPDFTLITGPNGAGKSHLLQAIYQGLIKTDVAPEQNAGDLSRIRLFDWSTMIPQDTGFFSSENIRQERQNLYSQYTNLKLNHGWLEPARNIIRDYGLSDEYLSEPGRVASLSDIDLASLLGDIEKVAALRQGLIPQLNQFEHNVLSNLSVDMREQLRAVSASTKRPISALLERDILSPAIPTWGQNDLFQQNFAKLFVAYRDLLLANNLAEYRASKGNEATFLTEQEFIEKHGPAPWDFVNEFVRDAGLDFSINSPVLDEYTQFQPMLTKRSTGVPVAFSALSSGEKVLMSFAFCVYYSNDRRQLSVQPKVLLLDEIDAPLHPSMSKNVIDTITKTLIGTFGIKVIATTHSPSTVALAPEESIFTMIPGQSGLHKSSKASALNILTVGVPTISISYDGRRQVFVESPTDAQVYDSLYKLIKPKIVSDRSLEFVATGTRTSGGGDVNTGCDNVKRIVEDLSSAGNISVFGLLDWDGKNRPTDRISVLAFGSRNGIENVVFDPLLIAITICRGFPAERHQIGATGEFSYFELATYTKEQFLPLVTTVCEKIFLSAASETIVSKYVNGLELEIDARCATTDDHELEGMILRAFPFLNSISKNQAGKLLDHVINLVLADGVGFMPMEVMDVMVELLERPAHS
ncbi:hypothetical protein MMA231_02532 [Asticcacaulis sp. MM231]|uniref:AAA family ATPase n=1 Tax=Asticcacaulis sp. MM231 TaxID=3157666 RepID=UPI0032D5A5E4